MMSERGVGPGLTRRNAASTHSSERTYDKGKVPTFSGPENPGGFIFPGGNRKFKRLAMLWSIGKDSSVLLWLARKAFFGHIPVPCVHVDTSYKIPEMIAFR